MKIDKTEIAVSTLKGLIGAIPFAGGLLNETLFEYRSRIKQNRIEKFVEALGQSLQDKTEDKIDLDQIKKEDFSDFFESVLITVTRTRSDEKTKRLKTLLLNQLIDPVDIEYSELFLKMIDSLHEKQLLILNGLSNVPSTFIDSKGEYYSNKKEFDKITEELRHKYFWTDKEERYQNEEIRKLEDKKKTLKDKLDRLDIKIIQNNKPYQPRTYKCDGSEYFYLVQDLCNKSLLVDIGIDAPPFELVEITQLGIDLVNRLRE
ncbi:MAG TPA: hypothetical protein PLJ60_05255 [Chryseolinea sp.]|nr:hypothetical protein [Chryseolinea sp.]HPH46051.1 hypothetical protein [Chryseolinea sp.]HPM29726.1 hypothetical protein [Chryseolinea sp.]